MVSEEQLRDASEIVEHYTTSVYIDMTFDCDDYRGLGTIHGISYNTKLCSALKEYITITRRSANRHDKLN
jgi:hypothetical protein